MCFQWADALLGDMETTVLDAVYAAHLASGFWPDMNPCGTTGSQTLASPSKCPSRPRQSDPALARRPRLAGITRRSRVWLRNISSPMVECLPEIHCGHLLATKTHRVNESLSKPIWHRLGLWRPLESDAVG